MGSSLRVGGEPREHPGREGCKQVEVWMVPRAGEAHGQGLRHAVRLKARLVWPERGQGRRMKRRHTCEALWMALKERRGRVREKHQERPQQGGRSWMGTLDPRRERAPLSSQEQRRGDFGA